MARRVKASVSLIRPHNCLGTLGLVIIGAQLANTSCETSTIVLACITVFLMTAAGNALNDYFDVEIDRVNRPSRPLPSRQIGRDTAWKLFIALSLIGLLLSVLQGLIPAIVTFSAGVLSFLYSWKLKRTVIIGNVSISFLTALAVIYGGIIAGHPGPSFNPAIIVSLFMMWREMVKTVADHEGDLAQGARTLSTVVGKSGAIRLSSVIAGVLVVAAMVCSSLAPQLAADPFVMFTVVLPTLVACNATLLAKPSTRGMSTVLRVTKGVFGVWLVTMLLS